MDNLKESAKIVQQKLYELGYRNQVVELPDSTRTAKEAAEAIGCEPAQIAKSIIFRLAGSGQPLLVIASGINRVNEQRISALVGDTMVKADADYVRTYTGFVIGGVPPVSHKERIKSFIDEDLFQYKEIWAAAGHPKAVFQLTPEELADMTGGTVTSVK